MKKKRGVHRSQVRVADAIRMVADSQAALARALYELAEHAVHLQVSVPWPISSRTSSRPGGSLH